MTKTLIRTGVPICVPYSFRQDAEIAPSRAGKKSVTSLIYYAKGRKLA